MMRTAVVLVAERAAAASGMAAAGKARPAGRGCVSAALGWDPIAAGNGRPAVAGAVACRCMTGMTSHMNDNVPESLEYHKEKSFKVLVCALRLQRSLNGGVGRGQTTRGSGGSLRHCGAELCRLAKARGSASTDTPFQRPSPLPCDPWLAR